MGFKISVIEGDGIGPEIMKATIKVLELLNEKQGLGLEFKHVDAGDKAKEKYGEPLPNTSFEVIRNSHCCLKGPIGETAGSVIVPLRMKLDLYANIRPAVTLPSIASLFKDVDILIVRENTEGLYKGIEDKTDEYAFSVRVITRKKTERIAEEAYWRAAKRKRKVTVVHKANVLASCRLFREVCLEVSRRHPEIQTNELYVDNAAYQLIKNPLQFDVILVSNMFGDILSDEAAAVVGSLGLCPAANIGERFAIFEPVHGSAPDIPKEYGNPTAMMLAAKMMLEWLGEKHGEKKLFKAAQIIWKSICDVLREKKVRTPDIGGNSRTEEFASEVMGKISLYV